jgi:hypothetical protein
MDASSTLLAVSSGRIGYNLSRLWRKQIEINLVAMENLCWTSAKLVHTFGRPGLVSLAFQPPTINPHLELPFLGVLHPSVQLQVQVHVSNVLDSLT